MGVVVRSDCISNHASDVWAALRRAQGDDTSPSLRHPPLLVQVPIPNSYFLAIPVVVAAEGTLSAI